MGKETVQTESRRVGRPREIPKRYKTDAQQNWYRVLRRMINGGASRLAIRVMRNQYYGDIKSSRASMSQPSIQSGPLRKDTSSIRTELR